MEAWADIWRCEPHEVSLDTTRARAGCNQKCETESREPKVVDKLLLVYCVSAGFFSLV